MSNFIHRGVAKCTIIVISFNEVLCTTVTTLCWVQIHRRKTSKSFLNIPDAWEFVHVQLGIKL